MQRGNRVRIVAERAQHLVGVGAECRRHAVEAAAAVFEPKAGTCEAQAAIGRVELLDRTARGDLRMVDGFLDLPDAGAGRAGGLQDRLPFARAFGRKLLLDDGAQRKCLTCRPSPSRA